MTVWNSANLQGPFLKLLTDSSLCWYMFSYFLQGFYALPFRNDLEGVSLMWKMEMRFSAAILLPLYRTLMTFFFSSWTVEIYETICQVLSCHKNFIPVVLVKNLHKQTSWGQSQKDLFDGKKQSESRGRFFRRTKMCIARGRNASTNTCAGEMLSILRSPGPSVIWYTG